MVNSYRSGETHLVKIDSLSVRLPDRVLLEDISLQVQAGNRIGITGPSGCGKTTLLRSIVGRQLTGESSAHRFEITPGRVGYVPQQGGLLPWYSLERNLNVFAGDASVNWCKDILSALELTNVRTSYPQQLSGGELQRARLACALAAKPVLCCADEPLTEVGLRQKWRLLQRWSSEMNRRRTALILVSHDIDTLIYLCDEAIILDGTDTAPARIIDRIKIQILDHPRHVHDLNRSPFQKIRQDMSKLLYRT